MVAPPVKEEAVVVLAPLPVTEARVSDSEPEQVCHSKSPTVDSYVRHSSSPAASIAFNILSSTLSAPIAVEPKPVEETSPAKSRAASRVDSPVASIESRPFNVPVLVRVSVSVLTTPVVVKLSAPRSIAPNPEVILPPLSAPTLVSEEAVTVAFKVAPESVPAAAVMVIPAVPSKLTPLIALAVCKAVAVEAFPVTAPVSGPANAVAVNVPVLAS